MTSYSTPATALMSPIAISIFGNKTVMPPSIYNLSTLFYQAAVIQLSLALGTNSCKMRLLWRRTYWFIIHILNYVTFRKIKYHATHIIESCLQLQDKSITWVKNVVPPAIGNQCHKSIYSQWLSTPEKSNCNPLRLWEVILNVTLSTSNGFIQ